MSKLQDVEQYKQFITRMVYPIVDELETRGWQFGGNGKEIDTKVYPICQGDIEDLRNGKYDGHKYQIGNYPENTVLVKHPFRPYELIPSDTSEADIINDHFHDLAMIFAALGAESCEETAKIVKYETVEYDAKGRMRIKTVKVKGSVKGSTENSSESEYVLKIEHESDATNGYENAYRMAEKNGLLDVREIKNILKYFDPEKGGKDKVYQLSEVLTEKYHKTLDAVIEVNTSGAFKFNGSLNVDHKSRRTIRIDKTNHFS